MLMSTDSRNDQICNSSLLGNNSLEAFQPPTKNVKSFILNHAAPKSLEELLVFIHDHGRFHLEEILSETNLEEWSVPRWAGVGDIIFFMHAKTADQTFRNLRKELDNSKEYYSDDDYLTMSKWIDRGLKLHKVYGGKIVAIGQVVGPPKNMQPETDNEREFFRIYHWNSYIYALVNHVHVLTNPVDISAFNSFIHVSRRGGITPVFGENFDRLKVVISKNNEIPNYFLQSTISAIPFTKIDQDNWLQVTHEYRRRFILEEQLRAYYTNHLLRELGSIKTIYQECRCRKAGSPDTFVDNVIRFGEKYLPVEIKLLVSAERNIGLQLTQYCNCDSIVLDRKIGLTVTKDQIHPAKTLVIDRDEVFIYEDEDVYPKPIFKLRNLKTLDDIKSLRKQIFDSLKK